MKPEPFPTTISPKTDRVADALKVADLCARAAHVLDEQRPFDPVASVLRRAAQTIHALAETEADRIEGRHEEQLRRQAHDRHRRKEA